MKCCDITAGKMRSKITLERNTPASDGEGGFTDAWAADPVGGVYAMVKAMGGSERWQAERITPGNRYRFVIRYRDDGSGGPYYSARDRVIHNGREYGIESVIDVEDERRYLEILAVENKAS